MPFKKRIDAAPAGPTEAPSGLQRLLAGGARVGSGMLAGLVSNVPGPGTVAGAGIGGLGEIVAQKLETPTEDLNWGRIGVESAIGAVPMSGLIKGGRALTSAVRSGAMGAVGEGARQVARGEDLDPAWILGAGAIGGLTGGLFGKMTPGAPKGPVVPKAPDFEVVPNYQTGIGTRVLTGKGHTAMPVPPRNIPQAAGVTYGPPVSVIDETVEAGGRIPYQTGIDPFGSAAKSAAREESEMAKLAKELDKRARENTKLTSIRTAREQAGATAQKTSFGASTSAQTPEGGSESMRTTFKKPGKAGGGGKRNLTDLEAALVEGEDTSFAALQKLLGKGNDLPPAGTPAREVFDAWIAKGRDPKTALKLAAKGTRPLQTAAEPVAEAVVPVAAQAAEAVPTATYLGEQEGLGPLFNIEGGPSSGSTVSTETLQKMGIEVPPVPATTATAAGEAPLETLYKAGKVLTPAQQAQEDSYRALQERLRAEGSARPTAAPAAEGIPTPQPVAEVPPQGIQEPPATPPVVVRESPSVHGVREPGLIRPEGIFRSRADAAGQHYRQLRDMLNSGQLERGPKKTPSPASIGRGIAAQASRTEGEAIGLPLTPPGYGIDLTLPVLTPTPPPAPAADLQTLLSGPAKAATLKKGSPEYAARQAAAARAQHAARRAAQEATPATPPVVPEVSPQVPVGQATAPEAAASTDQWKGALETLRARGVPEEEILGMLDDIEPPTGGGGGTVLGSGLGGLQDLFRVAGENPGFTIRAGLAGTGALVGAAANEDNPLMGAAVGAGVGAGLPSVVNQLRNLGVVAERIPGFQQRLSSPEEIKGLAVEIGRSMPQVLRFNYLTGTGLIPNAIIGPYGSAIMGALEHGLSGDARGWAALKLLTPPKFYRAFRAGRDEARRLLEAGELGRGETDLIQNLPPAAHELLSFPGRMMTSGDVAARSILMEAGFSPDEAMRITLTAEPTGAFESLANIGRANKPGQAALQMMFPFRRTPANIGQQGLERTPGLGLLYRHIGGGTADPIRQQLVQQALGVGAGAAGFVAGQNTEAPILRKSISNFGGQYSLPTMVGYMAGQAVRKGQQPLNPKVVGQAIRQGFPLPTTEPIEDLAKLLTSGEVPRGAYPAIGREIAELISPVAQPLKRFPKKRLP